MSGLRTLVSRQKWKMDKKKEDEKQRIGCVESVMTLDRKRRHPVRGETRTENGVGEERNCLAVFKGTMPRLVNGLWKKQKVSNEGCGSALSPLAACLLGQEVPCRVLSARFHKEMHEWKAQYGK